ncbi:MAG: magnesium/cobalt transporter CorA [Acidobacteriia bacterium]|nr:magnesium/cobalt transporter CorA [Terriglobia bacterium]
MRRRTWKRFHPPGTSPGTLSVPAAAEGKGGLTLVTYRGDSVSERHLAAVAEVPAAPAAGENLWLRIVGHSGETLGSLTARFGVHPLVLEDVVNLGQRPKVEEFDDYLFIVVDVLRFGTNGGLEEEQVSLLLFENLLITIEERESDLFKLVEDRLRSGRGKMRTLGVDYLAYALVDAAVDHFFPALERTGERIDEVEDELLERPDRQGFEKLHGIKRDLLRLRKATWPLREAVAKLTRTDVRQVREGTRVWLRDVYDHTVQIIDIVETFRDMTAELVDLYLSSVSTRLNEIMKVLTIIATIFIPLTFIVGLYGMNFNTQAGPLSMPELNWRWGYPAVWVLMLAIAGGMLWMFRRRRWL